MDIRAGHGTFSGRTFAAFRKYCVQKIDFPRPWAGPISLAVGTLVGCLAYSLAKQNIVKDSLRINQPSVQLVASALRGNGYQPADAESIRRVQRSFPHVGRVPGESWQSAPEGWIALGSTIFCRDCHTPAVHWEPAEMSWQQLNLWTVPHPTEAGTSSTDTPPHDFREILY